MDLAVLEPQKIEEKFPADPLVSMVVPIYNIEPMILKRCLMSLADQDYENLEVVCVLDGPNAELRRVAEQYPQFKLIEIEHGGACAARNAGFEASSGEIVSFFNSDYIAKEGMIRLWVDKLIENPDCGFVYGGYEYNATQRWIFPSGNFDAWQLEVENYIDCGFPLWRKYVVEWDVNCKSLQDWDFWIRVIKKHNVKGHYLGRDYSFIAEMPREKGLSDDSSNNWIPRVRYVKEKNGIPLRPILVTSLGAPNHAVEIAKMIGADYRAFTFDKPSEYEALYMIGFYIKPGEENLNEHSRRLAIFKDKYPKSKRIVHFVGADIYWLRKFPFESLKYLAGALRLSCDHILSENQAAHDELLAFGIPSEIVPIPSYTENWDVKPLPDTFKVALYLVENGKGTDFDKYCYEQTLSIVRAMPDIQFTGYGPGGKELAYPNLTHAGFIPREKWPEYVYDNSALVRLVRHDTQPMANNEFMRAGRDVISNIPGECTHLIETKGTHELNEWDQFSEGFNQLHWPETKLRIIHAIRAIKKGDRRATIDVSNSLKQKFDRDTYIKKIRGICGL